MGLRIQVVSGWSKGYGYTSGQRFEGPTNHAWNAVLINGQWRLMDPTWGAGYLDQQMQFVRRFQEHYFLTAPDAFVFDHLPQDSRWQLLQRPLSGDEYADLVYLRPMFFVAGFRIGSHPRARVAADDRVTVTLGVTQPVQMMARVVDPATDRPLEGDYAFGQVNDTTAEVHAAFPRPGDYVLRLFAKARGAEGSLQWVLDYRVQVSRGASDAAFPMAYTGFGETGAWLLEPFSGVLQAGRTYRFRLRAPGALDVAVVAGGHWTHLAREGEEFTGEVPAVAGDVVVYARYDPTSNFTGLLRYTGR
jgi:transglutaminase/protease-like cytokinesis protein 3